MFNNINKMEITSSHNDCWESKFCSIHKNNNKKLSIFSIDIFNEIYSFLDFDNFCQILFINKSWHNLVIPNYNKIKQNIIDNEYKIILYCDAIKQNKFILINFLIYLKINYCNDGLKLAAGLNNQKINHFLISKGANDWNSAVISAAENNHTNMIEYMLLKGANNWNSILAIVYKNKNKEVIKYMRLKSENDWKLSLALIAMDTLILIRK